MQNNRFTYTGKVYELGETKTFASGFKRRELICEVKGEKYTDLAVFTVKKDTCDKIGTLQKGDEVKVDFVLEGRSWDGPKGRQWFGGATALKVELVSGVNRGSLNAKPEDEPQPGDDPQEELPF